MSNVLNSRLLLHATGRIIGHYFRFVAATSVMQNDMQSHFDEVQGHLPALFTFWHGEQFMIPSAVSGHLPIAVLVSRHFDGEVMNGALKASGIETIRGSGGRNRAKTLKKGGVQGSLEMLTSLENGTSIAMTANIPKGSARKVGKGIVMLAKLSGRPIFPVAHVTNRNWTVKSWDKTAINLPFSRSAFTLGQSVTVSSDADEIMLEKARQKVEDELVRITDEARGMVFEPAQS